MIKFGIMQGRIYPDSFSKYNLFPTRWAEEFYLSNKIGFNYMELIYDKKQNKKNPIVNTKLNSIFFRRVIQNKVYSINLDYFTQNNIFNNLVKSKKIIKKIISITNKLKIKIIVIPCIEKNYMSQDRLINFIDIIKKLIKNQYSSISLEVQDFDERVLKNLTKKVGLCYDTGNLAIKSNKYLYFLEKNFEYINHIHLKDKIKKNKVNCKLGLGIVNFKKLFLVLKKKKYKGSITLETSFKKNPLKEAKQNLKFAKSFL